MAYALLVGFNLGEFWPFSIYPMFSQGANPWSRALVREMPPQDSIRWGTTDLENLPGAPFSVTSVGVDPIDLANFVSKTKSWNTTRIEALRNMFFVDSDDQRRLLVFKVQGRLSESDEVLLTATPYVLLSPGNNKANPSLRP